MEYDAAGGDGNEVLMGSGGRYSLNRLAGDGILIAGTTDHDVHHVVFSPDGKQVDFPLARISTTRCGWWRSARMGRPEFGT